MRVPRFGIAPRKSCGDAVFILSFAFGALVVATGMVAGLPPATALVLVEFAGRLSPLELHAATNISVKDRSGIPEISFRGNIGSPFESNCLGWERRGIIAKEA